MILQKIKTLLATFLPYKLSSEEKKFIRLNSQLWNKKAANKAASGYILVEGLLSCPASIIDKARMANAIAEATGKKPIVFVRGLTFSASNVAAIFRSFSIEHYYYWWRNYLNPAVLFPTFIQTIRFFVHHRTGESIIPLTYRGIVIGDLIYDSLIRFKPENYTINRIILREHFRLVFRAFYTFHNNEILIRKFNAKILVTSHNVYAEFGLLPRQIRAINSGVIFLKDTHVYKYYSADKNINEHFLKLDKQEFELKFRSKKYEKEAERYFIDRISGHVSQIDVINAYRNKKKYSLDDLKERYPQINTVAKNIFVMSHAFSDSPHVGEGLLFKDYYDFLEKTLCVLDQVAGINCFVKAHPSSYMWNEKGGVETLVANNGLKNVVILPADFNTSAIAELADAIVTAKGTAGLEFSAAGVPAVTAGKGFYYGFGIADEPETTECYFEKLKSLETVEKLDKETRRRALVLLYLISVNKYHSAVLPQSHIFPGDDYQGLYRSKYDEVNTNILNGEKMKDAFYQQVKSDAEHADV